MLEYDYFGPANPEIDYGAKVLGQADRSIALAHDNAFAYQVKSGYYLFVLHLPEEALRAADAALAIKPNSPYFDAVIDESNKAIDAGYRVFYSYLNLAARPRAQRRHRRSEGRLRRSSPSQPEAQRQMAERAQTYFAARVRSPTQSGVAGGMIGTRKLAASIAIDV
jgi:hypothetical protein